MPTMIYADADCGPGRSLNACTLTALIWNDTIRIDKAEDITWKRVLHIRPILKGYEK